MLTLEWGECPKEGGHGSSSAADSFCARGIRKLVECTTEQCRNVAVSMVPPLSGLSQQQRGRARAIPRAFSAENVVK